MTREEYLSKLLKQQGHTIQGFARQIGIPTSTLRSILKNVGGASVDNIFKICSGLGITTEQLNDMPCIIQDIPKLSQDHQNLLDLYDQLHEDDKIRIITKMETIIEDYNQSAMIRSFRAASSKDHHEPEIVGMEDLSVYPESDIDNI